MFSLLKTLRKRVVLKWDHFTKNITWIERGIDFQHKNFPIPLKIYDYIFRFNFIKVFFNFYGYHVWRAQYNKREGNHLSYWTSKESLYWHFWRQTDKNGDIQQILKIPGISAFLQNNSLIACEFGFGIGKHYRQHWNKNNLKEYIAMDVNKYICDYDKRFYRKDKNLRVINSSIEEFINGDQKFDILISSGEVFAYLQPSLVDCIFKRLREKGTEAVIILNEGCMTQDIVWEDGTIEYNFKKRLLENGYTNKNYYYQEHENKVLKYIVMC
ncbi:MAG: hypothetical protein P4L35_00175 [Ignavibacteriaceae bacterium]|nr:hypothetical protein [Ignavibacteriaceae bacterium]